MEWKKTPPGLAAAFDKATPKDANIVRKSMFGYPALFLNGNMFAGTFQDQVVAKLNDADLEKARKSGVKQFEPMPGRPMKAFVVIPSTDVSTPAALASWIERAHRNAETMPPKVKLAAKATKQTTTKKTGAKRA